MDENQNINKKNYFNRFLVHTGTKVRPLVQKAMPYVTTGKIALEIGGGMLNDTKFLLKQGFSVVAVDPSELTPIEAVKINDERLTVFNDVVENYPFPKNHFDLVTAQYSLMYVTAELFEEIFNKIAESLVADGILAVQLFGPENAMPWLAPTTLTHDIETIKRLLEGFEIIFIKEFKNDEVTSITGIKGLSHDIRILAKKK